MPISQPSPDRLVFQPKYKSIISFQIFYGILIPFWLLGGGGSLLGLAYIFSATLSKSLRASYLNIFNDGSELLAITFFVVLLLTVFSIFFFYLTWLLFNHHITDSCTFDRTSSPSSDLYFGEVYIQQRNIFNRKRTIKIPLDKIVDIRIQYFSWLYISCFDVLLDTTLSARSIYISKLAQNVKLIVSLEPILVREGVIPSLIEEIESIREFLYLPLKPSYLVDGSINYLPITLLNFHQAKILQETPDNFTYHCRCKLPWYNETYNFDSNLGVVTIESRYLGQKLSRRIAMNTIRSIVIKREISTPMDSIGEAFNCQTKERYSAILVPIESYPQYTDDYRAFYIPGNLPNGYRRLYTSSNRSDVQDFTDRLNYYLSSADRASQLESIY
jgi:hypothetical protein